VTRNFPRELPVGSHLGKEPVSPLDFLPNPFLPCPRAILNTPGSEERVFLFLKAQKLASNRIWPSGRQFSRDVNRAAKRLATPHDLAVDLRLDLRSPSAYILVTAELVEIAVQ
jgi:hypothetical protein